MVVDYVTTMLTSNGDSPCEEILDSIHCRVTEDMNRAFCAAYSDSEINETLFQMGPHTAPGPDGTSPFFFQKFWDIVGEDVVSAVRSFSLPVAFFSN